MKISSQVFESIEDGFAFMSNIQRDDDKVMENEKVEVHPRAFNLHIPQTDAINHDTGATRHIFVNKDWFHNYEDLISPLKMLGFGSDLSATAIGKGTIILKATHNNTTRQFSLSNVLHIPTARSNLISGSRLDKKGVSTLSGKGTPFASGKIIYNLYQMSVLPVKQPDNSTTQNLIAAMIPSITTMFGPVLESASLGFTTV